jgi:hypothetical protein
VIFPPRPEPRILISARQHSLKNATTTKDIFILRLVHSNTLFYLSLPLQRDMKSDILL